MVDAVQVQVDDVVPLLVGHLVELLPNAGACVQEDHVQPAEAVDRGAHHLLAHRLLRHVAEQEVRLAAVGLDETVGAGIAALRHVGADDLRPLAGEQSRRRSADAALGAGHHRDLSAQPAKPGPHP